MQSETDADAWRAGRKTGLDQEVYHTDPDCFNFPSSPCPLDPEERDDLRECQLCRDGAGGPPQQDRSHFRSLKEAARDD